MPKAYSYIRFSSAEQRKGDSLRRQTAAAQRYCRAHGLELDAELTLQDLGRSAFHGANLTGALGAFLEAVQAGHVEPGSVLIVESVDRISRQGAWAALPTIQALIGAGVSIATLSPERLINSQELERNPFSLMEMLLYLIRAHEESATKSRRAKEAWVGRRARVANGEPQHLGKLPSWVRLRSGRFTLDPERVKVIRQMAGWVLEGAGQLGIARRLNDSGVPPFGRGKMWHKGNIYDILRQPSLVGTADLYVCDREGGRMVRRKVDSVEGYFPPALDREVWEAVQATINSRAPQRGAHAGRPLRNIFAGLARCPVCGGGVQIHSDMKNRYLVCGSYRQQACKNRIGLRYDRAEFGFLVEAAHIIREAPAGEDLEAAIREARGAVLGAWEEAEVVAEALVRVGASETLEARLRRLEGEGETARAEVERLEAQAAESASSVVTARLAALSEAIAEDPLNREAVNLALRQAAEKIVAHPDRLDVHWRHGGVGDVPV
jgi:DNA invertase Pin-like site-specific DNA recombinase